MSEISIIDDELAQTPGRPPAPARPPITDISQWIERFSLMAAVLCTRFPDKAPELWAYQATIVQVERNYDGKHWVAYDRQVRREALARKDLNWSITDPRLYNEAFTGRARSISCCTFCLQDDHTAAYCPHNPSRPVFGWFPDPTFWPVANTHTASYPRYPPHWRFAAATTMVAVSKCDANIVTPAVAVKGRTPLSTALSARQTTQLAGAAHHNVRWPRDLQPYRLAGAISVNASTTPRLLA